MAVDPVDGTRLVAHGLPNAISVIVASEKGSIPYIPTFYSLKLAVGPELAGKLDINAPIRENLRVAAAALDMDLSELTVILLNRERHRDMIEEIRSLGARIKLISDGDIAAAIATSLPDPSVNIYIGIGGTPEGILAAAALKSLGGEIQMKPWPTSDEEKENLISGGYDTEKVYTTDDLIGKNAIFAATGITNGEILRGVRFQKRRAITDSIVMRSATKTIRRITAYHDLDHKTIPLKSSGETQFIRIQTVRT